MMRKGKRREEGRSGKSLVNGLDPTRALRNVVGGAVITAKHAHSWVSVLLELHIL